jgi:hypothetical protein
MMPDYSLPEAVPRLLSDLAWVLLLVGVALIIASRVGRIASRYAWTGAALAATGLGVALTAPPLQTGIFAVGIIFVALQLTWRQRKKLWRRSGGAERAWDQEAALLRLCGGDDAAAERLIRFELERNPNLSRAGAALAAAARLRHEK